MRNLSGTNSTEPFITVTKDQGISASKKAGIDIAQVIGGFYESLPESMPESLKSELTSGLFAELKVAVSAGVKIATQGK